MIDGGDGFLYGTSALGGIFPRLGSTESTWSRGTVFKIRKDGSGFQILYSNPYGTLKAPLMAASDGWFYGVVLGEGDGSANPHGFVYRIGRTVGSFEVVWAFQGGNGGSNPAGQLVEGNDGFLYGLTTSGGQYDGGVAYRLLKNGEVFQVIHEFQNAEGSSFEHGLRFQSDEKIYGAAKYGGNNDRGTVFRMDADGSGFEVVFQPGLLNVSTVQFPISPPLLMPDGKLYGLTRVSSFYRMNTDGSGFETLLELAQNSPMSHLELGPDGNFYFMAQNGLFKVTYPGLAVEQLFASAGYNAIQQDTGGSFVFSSSDEIYVIQTSGPAFDPLSDGNVLDIPGAIAVLSQGGVLKLTPGTDFGDAPSAAQSGFAQSYPVTLAEDGARHTSRGPLLGNRRNSEKDGTHQASALGDIDGLNIPGGRDGVSFGRFSQGGISLIKVSVNGGGGKLDAWIDFNRDGDWDDEGEQVFQSLPVAEGDTWLLIPIPADAELGKTYARFRLSTAGGLSPRGLADDGEVEDYEVTIADVEGTGGNDDFANAYSLIPSRITVTGTTTGATLETGEPLPAGYSSATRSRWYRWTARAEGEFAIKATPSDAVIAVWSGESLQTLTQIAVGRSTVTVAEPVVGTEYWIQITDTAATGVDFTLSIEGAPAFNEAYFKSLSSYVPGTLGFELRGGGSLPYVLEYTEDWLTWHVLKTGNLTNGVVTVEDTEASAVYRFYRLRLQTAPE